MNLENHSTLLFSVFWKVVLDGFQVYMVLYMALYLQLMLMKNIKIRQHIS